MLDTSFVSSKKFGYFDERPFPSWRPLDFRLKLKSRNHWFRGPIVLSRSRSRALQWILFGPCKEVWFAYKNRLFLLYSQVYVFSGRSVECCVGFIVLLTGLKLKVCFFLFFLHTCMQSQDLTMLMSLKLSHEVAILLYKLKECQRLRKIISKPSNDSPIITITQMDHENWCKYVILIGLESFAMCKQILTNVECLFCQKTNNGRISGHMTYQEKLF